MKWLLPAVIIGFTGGFLGAYTDLHWVWCFIIGALAFYVFLFVKSIFTTARIMRETKGSKKIWINQNNNVVKKEF